MKRLTRATLEALLIAQEQTIKRQEVQLNHEARHRRIQAYEAIGRIEDRLAEWAENHCGQEVLPRHVSDLRYLAGIELLEDQDGHALAALQAALGPRLLDMRTKSRIQ